MKILRNLSAACLMLAAAPVGAQTTTLDFPTYQLQESFGPWWQALTAEFEKQNPGVKINLTNAPSNDHHRMLTTRFAAGNPPDIVHMTARFVWGYGAEGVPQVLGSEPGGDDGGRQNAGPRDAELRLRPPL
ncbi:MAG: hypothetical protein B7Z14_15680 [Bosea sp. 32-68-6]|nr:MAG: hypothetical protein B7Z14_15680 [Bosea sp. 32-68-6]